MAVCSLFDYFVPSFCFCDFVKEIVIEVDSKVSLEPFNSI